jgi:hypothetical protein
MEIVIDRSDNGEVFIYTYMDNKKYGLKVRPTNDKYDLYIMKGLSALFKLLYESIESKYSNEWKEEVREFDEKAYEIQKEMYNENT